MPMVEDATAAEQAMHKQMQADMAQVFRTEFAAADKNSDGKLSFAEFARDIGQEAWPADVDGELPGDKDKDGQLSLSEYVALFDVPTYSTSILLRHTQSPTIPTAQTRTRSTPRRLRSACSHAHRVPRTGAATARGHPDNIKHIMCAALCAFS